MIFFSLESGLIIFAIEILSDSDLMLSYPIALATSSARSLIVFISFLCVGTFILPSDNSKPSLLKYFMHLFSLISVPKILLIFEVSKGITLCDFWV